MTPRDLDDLQAAVGERYRLERVIGTGGMGTVILAEDVKHRRRVAVKVLRPEISAMVGDRFLREIEIVARLQHPHVLPLYDSCQEHTCLYYVMPYVDGESLGARLEREGALPLEEALRITREVADALGYAHAQGVVHRDIKPENILLSGGHALLADFGIARALDAAGGTALTQAGWIVGTPGYMSPEQGMGDPGVDARSDVYSLGCVLFEMLTGHPPFAGTTPAQIVTAQLREAAPSPRSIRGELPASLDAAVRRALAPAAADRFGSVQALVAALEAPATFGARRGRGTWIAVAAAVVLGAAAIGMWAWQRGADATLSRTAVAVLPFTVRGGADVAYLGEGMVSLLSTKLDGAGDLRSVEPRALLRRIADAGAGEVDPGAARAVARAFGAGLFVMGDVVEASGSLQLTATLYQTGDPEAPTARASVTGPVEEVFALVDQMAADLLTAWSRQGGTNLVRLSSVTTASLPAFKAYLDGEQAFRRSDYATALTAFERAVAEDSLFALAWYRLSTAAEYLTQAERALAAAERARGLSDRLPTHDRRLLEANFANRRGDAAEAERLYRVVTTDHPEDVEAWFQLGEVLFHYNPALARSAFESQRAWERVVALEPDHLPALLHLARLHAARGNAAAIDTLLVRMLAVERGPDLQRSEAVEVETMLALLRSDSARIRDVLGRLAGEAFVTQSLTLYSVAAFVADPAALIAVARALLVPGVAPTMQAEALAMLASVEAGRGRWRRAGASLDSLAALDQGLALEHRALLALVPEAPVTLDDLRRLRQQVARMDTRNVGPPAGPTGMFYNVHDGLHAELRIYLLGALDLRLGDTAAARTASGALERMAPGHPRGDIVRQLAGALRADLALAAGQMDAAMAALEVATATSYYNAMAASPFSGGARPRFQRGQVLEALGQPGEAARWYGSLRHMSAFDYPYEGMALVARAVLLDSLGRADEAEEARGRVLRLWSDADSGTVQWATARQVAERFRGR